MDLVMWTGGWMKWIYLFMIHQCAEFGDDKLWHTSSDRLKEGCGGR